MRIVLLCLVAALGHGLETGQNPIRGVVNMLQKMQKEIEAEGEKEKGLYDKYMCFCDGNTGKMTAEANELRDLSKKLAAQIEKDTGDKKQNEADLAEAKDSRQEANDAIAQAQSIRNKEKEAFDKLAGDTKANIDAINAAVSTLNAGMGKSFVQTQPRKVARIAKILENSADIESEDRDKVSAFLQGPYGDHQNSSEEIVGILKQMKDRMDSDLGGAVSTEEAAVAAFNELVAAKRKEIAAAQKTIEAKQERIGKLAVAIAEAKNQKRDAEATADETTRFLANLAEQCAAKKKEWEERTKARNEELVAVAETIKILNDDDVLEIFKRRLPGPKMSLLQVNRSAAQLQKQALALLQKTKSRNPALEAIELQLQSGKAVFDTIVNAIDKLVADLKNEQNVETEQFDACNKDIKQGEDEVGETKHVLETIATSMSETEDMISNLNDEKDEVQKDMKAGDKAVAEATEQRKEENTEFTNAVAETKLALQILDVARNRLRKQYAPDLYVPPKARVLSEEEQIRQNAGEVLPTPAPVRLAGGIYKAHDGSVVYGPPTFVQVNSHSHVAQPEAPETFEGPYKKHGNSGSVLRLMDMIMKDVEASIQQMEMDEQASQKAYEKFMADSTAKHKKNERQQVDIDNALAQQNGNLEDLKAQNTGSGKELATQQKMLVELHASCDFLVENHDVRRAARDNEIEALKQAKAVLRGADYSLLQVSDEPKEEENAAAEEMTKDLEVNFNKIAPFGKEDTAHELQSHASKTQDTLVDAVENAEVAEIKRAVFRALTRLRAATIKEFDTIARLETQAIDAYNDAHHYRAENPLTHLHDDEAPVPTDKLKSFH